MVTRYLDALIAHNPKTLPLAPLARFTEDAVEKQLGVGLWKSTLTLGTFRQDIFDVRAGTYRWK